MKKILILILALSFLGIYQSCKEDDIFIGAPDLNVNGGPIEETVTPNSIRVEVILSETRAVTEVGIIYAAFADESAIKNYGEVISTDNISEVIYFNIENLESETDYYYLAYAKLASNEIVYSVRRDFTTLSAAIYTTPGRLTLGAAASIDTLVVTTEFDAWSVLDSEYEWLSFETKDSLLIVHSEDNLTAEKRLGAIRLTAGGRTASVTVTQEIPTLELSDNENEVSGRGGEGSFEVMTDVAWTYKIENTSDWDINVSIVDNTFSYIVGPNGSDDYRTNHITIWIGTAISEVYTLHQRSGALDVTKSLIEIGTRGGDDGFIVESRDAWEIASQEGDWFTPRILDNDSIAITIDPNNQTTSVRTGTLTITSGDYSKDVTITQSPGIILSHNGTDDLFFWEGSGTITVEAFTDDWTVELGSYDGDEWKVTKLNDTTIFVETQQANETANPLTAQVIVKAGDLVQTITVSQTPANIALSPTQVTLSYQAATTRVVSTGGIQLTRVIVPDDAQEWLTCEIDPSNTTNIIVTVTENAGSTRSAIVTAGWAGVEETFTVSQLDPNSNVTLDPLPSGALAGSYDCTNTGDGSGVQFFGPIITKTDYEEKVEGFINANTANYDDRYNKFLAMEIDYAIGVNSLDGFVYPCLIKIHNEQSLDNGAPSGAYKVEMLALEEPMHVANGNLIQNAGWYDPKTETLYLDFVFWGAQYYRTMVKQ